MRGTGARSAKRGGEQAVLGFSERHCPLGAHPHLDGHRRITNAVSIRRWNYCVMGLEAVWWHGNNGCRWTCHHQHDPGVSVVLDAQPLFLHRKNNSAGSVWRLHLVLWSGVFTVLRARSRDVATRPVGELSGRLHGAGHLPSANPLPPYSVGPCRKVLILSSRIILQPAHILFPTDLPVTGWARDLWVVAAALPLQFGSKANRSPQSLNLDIG